MRTSEGRIRCLAVTLPAMGFVLLVSFGHLGICADGSTRTALELERTRAIDAAASDVQSAISAVSARLPQDLPTPAIAARGGER
jgi:hypothetical protein